MQFLDIQVEVIYKYIHLYLFVCECFVSGGDSVINLGYLLGEPVLALVHKHKAGDAFCM